MLAKDWHSMAINGMEAKVVGREALEVFSLSRGAQEKTRDGDENEDK